ncbi:hypothetical protein [Phenylobacterium sp.]|jgi:hypothetical protein|uniref:hypothetical protein n=1 Tax=Phenylobacterium sp. TaxID=1871053 RepID=UPI002E32E4E6|nr:hypothetical protein [Phenylobacterium sp.]HEX2560188.1 hypothetical protein [Phenylobacterium sp.]
MTGALVAAGLLCAALGFALSFAPRRALPGCLALTAGAAGLAGLLPAQAWSSVAFAGCWTSVFLCALAVHAPRGLHANVALALALNAGAWSGAVVAAAGAPSDLLVALPWTLICLPGAWIVSARRQIALKVMASWLAAVAVLAVALPALIPTPGYVADHME